MRIIAALLLLVILLACGCSTDCYSFRNGSHIAKHFTVIYDDFHRFHVDIDRVIFDIHECESDLVVTEK